MNNWRTLLAEGAETLRRAGVEGAMRDARLLLAHARDLLADRVMLEMEGKADPDAEAVFLALIGRRAAREPLSHLTGCRAFWGREFRVSSDVLDPRPETETLIAAALAQPFSRLLDLGTGSGAILATLLAERPDATGLGTDLSLAALAIANENGRLLGLDERAEWRLSDWFADVDGQFDLIVSNPPYIATDEIPALSPEVREWEPRIALTPGGDGLDAYRAIAAGMMTHLLPGGRVFLEIGPSQGEAVSMMLAEAGLDDIHILPDLDGRDRVVVAKRLSG
ncbi:MAG: peptide chain release factor N(5)-glutamine methyltransferase [Pseudorhodobacter sp.]